VFDRRSHVDGKRTGHIVHEEMRDKQDALDQRRRHACMSNKTGRDEWLVHAIQTYSSPEFAKDVSPYAGEAQFADVQKTTTGMLDSEDCHYVPQHVYAASTPAQYIFCKVSDAVVMLRSKGRAGTAVDTLRDFQVPQRHNRTLKQMSRQVKELMQKHYAKDMELFAPCT